MVFFAVPATFLNCPRLRSEIMAQARWLMWMLCTGLFLAMPSQAQEAASGQVDLQRLIASMGQGGGNANIQDPVWDLRPQGGQQFIVLPMIYQPGEAAYTVSKPAVSPRSARFVGFYIPSDRDQLNQNRGGNQPTLDLRTLTSGDIKAIEAMLLAEPLDPQQQAELERQRQEAERLRAEQEALQGIGEPEGPVVPEFAPRLARSIQISPEGTVTWEADRSIPGAELKAAGEQNMYAYKLDAQALRAAEPPRAERTERRPDEDSRVYSERRREDQLRQRDEQEAFRALRERVSALPDRFTQPLPEVIYLVFTGSDSQTLELQGPDPYPWKLTTDDANNLRALAQGRGGGQGQGPSVETNRAISVLANFLATGHPLSQQSVAVAAYEANLPGQVLEGDAGYRMLTQLLSSDDTLTRQITLTSLAQTLPPTRASAKLLADAAQSAPPELAQTLELASLRAMFSIDAAKSENAGFLVTLVNEAMRNPTGPSAGKVIDELLRALEQSGVMNNHAGPASADRVDVVLINRVDFSIVQEDQLDGVIAAIIRRSPTNSTASGWLDIKLLRSGDDRLVSRTLELLGQADAGSTLIKPLTADLRELVFDQPTGDADQPPLDLTLDGKIPLDSANHGIVTAITAADPTRRALAWQVLRHFEIAGSSVQSADGVDNQAATFELIVDSGLSEEQTPLYLIDFIDNQDEGQLAQRSAERINQILLLNVDPSAKMRAARKYLASPQRYGQLLPQVQPLERGVIVEELYALLTGERPMVLGLARDPQGQQTRWFVDYMQQTGALPTPAQWAASQTEQQLLQTATTPDNTVRAGAAAALVLNAGGDDNDRTQLLNAISPLATPDAQAIAQAWTPIKQGIYAKVLADAAGSYNLVLTLRGENRAGGLNLSGRPNPQFPPPNPGDPDADTTPAEPGDLAQPVLRQIELGVVDLKVNQLTVSLSAEGVPISVGDERLAIVLDDVSTLTGFNNPDLADLPLSQLRQWLELLPQTDGSWTGAMRLPDGRTLQVTLRPA